jgi:hypothetical protein
MRLSSIRRDVSSVVLLLFGLVGIVICQSNSSSAAASPLPPSAARFETGTRAVGIPFRVIDNNMYLTIRVNDSVEVEVAFDSGFPLNGVLIIDSAIGDRLGLKYVASTPLGGAGDESSIADVAVGATIALPGVSFKNQQVLVVRNTQRYKKWLAGGIIGGTVLNSCVVEVDHEKSVLNVYENSSFDSHAAGETFDLAFSQGVPVVKATIEDNGNTYSQVSLLVDTGADVPFSLYSNDGLELRPPANAPRSYISEGIKGDVYGQWSRIDAIRLGSLTMDNCIVAYPTEGFGDVVATLGQNGFFGLDAQRRFTLTFDYRHSRMYLKPNALFKMPFEFNMAGLILRTLRSGLKEVADVLPGSPGHLAGIKRGDRVIAVEGLPTSSLSASEFERLFIQENRSLTISTKRDSSINEAKLILKRMI